MRPVTKQLLDDVAGLGDVARLAYLAGWARERVQEEPWPALVEQLRDHPDPDVAATAIAIGPEPA